MDISKQIVPQTPLFLKQDYVTIDVAAKLLGTATAGWIIREKEIPNGACSVAHCG
jgi:hypothetical protein